MANLRLVANLLLVANLRLAANVWLAIRFGRLNPRLCLGREECYLHDRVA